MIWSRDQGAKALDVIAAAVERGEAVPEALIPPLIGEIESPFWESFVALSQARDPRDAAPLALGEIQAWCDLAGVSDPVSRRELLEVIQVLDRAWLEAAAIDDADRAVDHRRNQPPVEEPE